MKLYTLYIIYQVKCKGFSKVFTLKHVESFYIEDNIINAKLSNKVIEITFDKIITAQLLEE